MKTAAASLILAAGVSGQFFGSPYMGARVAAPRAAFGFSPYAMAAPRMMAAPVAVAAAPRVMAAPRAAPVVDVHDELVEQSLYYDLMSQYTTGNLQDLFTKYTTATDFELLETEAQTAFEAFKANPTRTTSLEAEAADSFAKAQQFTMYYPDGATSWPAGDNLENRFNYQGMSALMEVADDALKVAERRMSYDPSGADAYFNALSAYNEASDGLWIESFDQMGQADAYNHLTRQSYIDSKRADGIDDANFLTSFLMDDGGLASLQNEKLQALLVYNNFKQGDGPAALNQGSW